ncbi:MAG: DUF4129 domain-containing protein, partial [Parahaliea sp.]
GRSGQATALAGVLRTLVIAVLLALVLYLLLRYRDTLRNWASGTKAGRQDPQPPPEQLFGMAVTRESLPADVPAEVSALWRAGEHRAALALLYRSTLAQLLHRWGVPFTGDLTELECAALVTADSTGELSGFFNRLTQGWMRLAYGHIEPEQALVEDLCRQWRELFGRG